MRTSLDDIFDDKGVIIRRYKIRRSSGRGGTIEISVPREVFEREVRRIGLSVREALEKLEAVWRYDSFPGLHLTFERKGENAREGEGGHRTGG